MQTDIDKKRLEYLSQGDLDAFNELFNNYFPKLKKFLADFLGNKTEAEDLAQDVFVKLWQNRTFLANVDNLNAYLYSIAKNTLLNYIKRPQYNKFSSLANIVEPATKDMLEEIISANELEELISFTIEKMPPQRKTVFTLSRINLFSNDEIA